MKKLFVVLFVLLIISSVIIADDYEYQLSFDKNGKEILIPWGTDIESILLRFKVMKAAQRCRAPYWNGENSDRDICFYGDFEPNETSLLGLRLLNIEFFCCNNYSLEKEQNAIRNSYLYRIDAALQCDSISQSVQAIQELLLETFGKPTKQSRKENILINTNTGWAVVQKNATILTWNGDKVSIQLITDAIKSKKSGSITVRIGLPHMDEILKAHD